MVRVFVLLLCVLAGTASSLAGAQVARPPCSKVMSEVTREVSNRGGNRASPKVVARRLDTDQSWVRRCMQAYGRMPAQRERASDEDREKFERALEEGRSVEVDPERPEQRWEDKRQLEIERQERRAHQRALAKQKEFDERDDPFNTMPAN